MSDVFVQQGPFEWMNLSSGDVVRWDPETGVYQHWDPSVATWSWWGQTTDGTWRWYLYAGQVSWKLANFWVFLLIGLGALAVCASQGLAAVGGLLLGWFVLWGVLLSWLQTKHPTVYDVFAAACLGYLAWRVATRHDSR